MADNDQLERLQNEHDIEIPAQLIELPRDDPRWMELIRRQADLKLEIDAIRQSLELGS